ncbi:MAG: VCBS repeat-containing protein [Bacteroidia bacterium]
MRLSALALVLLFAACRPASPTTVLLKRHLPEQSGIDFRNQLFESDRLNIISWEYFYSGGGVGIGDFDNDGLPDLFFTGNMVNCRLYLNQGGLRFEDATAQWGIDTRGQWASGVSIADIDADGWLDIYVSVGGPYPADKRHNRCYINQQGRGFADRAAQLGLADTGHTTQAVFFDYDLDGDLDCYLLTNMMEEVGPNVIRPKKLDGTSINNDRLYRNDGDRFTDVTRQAGILAEGYGLGVSVCDLNHDGLPDLFVSNDYLSNDLLWINQGDGTFRDEAARYFRHSSYSAMGHDIGDIDNDGRAVVFTVDMLPASHSRQKRMFGATNYERYRSECRAGYSPQFMRNTLQLDQGTAPDGQPVFAEVGRLAGIHGTDWSWSALMADIDLDGHRDLLITNGYPRDITNLDFVDYKAGALFGEQRGQVDYGTLARALADIDGVYLPNYLYRNEGDLRFSDQSAAWGFDTPSYSHGMALGDLDGDGDLDMVINNLEDPAFLYENLASTLPDRHYLALRLEGAAGNLHGIGTTVTAWACGQRQVSTYTPVRGYQSSMQPGLWLGLGACRQLDSLYVHWPDGRTQWLTDIAADQQLTLRHRDADTARRHSSAQPEPVFREAHVRRGIDFLHIDPEYPDFNVQPLLPHKHSLLGPGMATGDIDGDGRTDFFIGGAFRQHGQLFRQQPDGRFIGEALEAGDKNAEDLGAVFFDAEGDGDLDLYVTSGSSELPAGHPDYQDRLYLNDGRGRFVQSDALPQMYGSTASVAAADFDRDGDTDLFVGGRITPQDYPTAPRSYLLLNEGGRFRDATTDLAPALVAPGMVTAAQWTDLDSDGWPDLVLVGEWMPLGIAYNRQGRFDTIAALPQSVGWWSSLAVADLDGDGDTDLLAGNLGLNSRLKTSPQQPVSLYLNDFNQDQRQDAILCHYLQGVEVPFHSRDDLVRQINAFRRMYPNYSSFADAGWADIFSPAQRAGMHVLRAETFASCWAENQGDGRFALHPLPQAAQFAPVCGVLPGDFDDDGHTDLLLVGNSQATEVQSGPYDALSGLLLRGSSDGFTPLTVARSGFYVPGDGRALASLRTADGQLLILAAQNNGPLRVFERP